jgi:hypothetical protein
MILTLQSLGVSDRDIHLYDTFEGMTEPTDHDTSPVDRSARDVWEEAERRGERAFSNFFNAEIFNEQAVRETLVATGYPADRLHFVRGPVEETIPDRMPDELALLRLDTDWYESTRHELEHLYSRVSPGGVLIFDDYSTWQGARKAVDEFIARTGEPLLLVPIAAGRIAVKPGLPGGRG